MTDPLEPSIAHGTDGAYTYHACRCDPCRRAHTTYVRDLREGRRGPNATSSSALPVGGPTGWMESGACVGADADLFFPVGTRDFGRHNARADSAEAKAICAGCDVRLICLDYALTNRIHDGVWGGKSEAERRTIIRKRRKKAS